MTLNHCTIPVPPPDGYRWHFRTQYRGDALGRLELVPANAHTDKLGVHWMPDDTPGKSRHHRMPALVESCAITRETQIRRSSIKLVRAHHAKLAAETRAAAAAARITKTLTGRRTESPHR